MLLIFNPSFTQWVTSGTNIYNYNSGSFGIGITTPTRKLDVTGTLSLSATLAQRNFNPDGTVADPNNTNIAQLNAKFGGLIIHSIIK